MHGSPGEVIMQKLIEYAEVSLAKVMNEGSDTHVNHWTAPVWQLDKINLNGRLYSTKLAQRIVAEAAKTGVCDGHYPSEHAEYDNFKAIAKNPRIENSQLWVDIYFVDKVYQEKIAQLAENGLPIGVSSVGFGETDMDGVVNADTYRLVRYLDFVTAPAGEVYAQPAKENTEKEANNESTTESEDPAGSEEDAAAAARKAKVERYKRIESILLR